MRPRNFRWLARFSTVVCATLALASVSACSSEEQSIQAGAKTVEGNVEESGRIMKETWARSSSQVSFIMRPDSSTLPSTVFAPA